MKCICSLLILYLCVSIVECQGPAFRVTPEYLDLNGGFLEFSLENMTGSPNEILAFDLSRVLISNCEDSCEFGVKQNYRLSQSNSLVLNITDTTVLFQIDPQDQEVLARHEVIGGTFELYIRVEEGFIASPGVYLIPGDWNSVLYIPYTFSTSIFSANTTCTDQNKLVLSIIWDTFSPILPLSYEVRFSTFVYAFSPYSDIPINYNFTVSWITQEFQLQREIEFGEFEVISNNLFWEASVIPLPDRSFEGPAFYGGSANLLDPFFSFETPDIQIIDGHIIASLPFAPQRGICIPSIVENLHCDNLASPNLCAFRDGIMTSEFGFRDTNFYGDYFSYLTLRYESTPQRRLFGIGRLNTTLPTYVFNSFTITDFFFGEFDLGLSPDVTYNGYIANYTFSEDVTVTDVGWFPIIAEPFCKNGNLSLEYTYDHNLIRIPVSEIQFSSCSGDGYYTISAVGNVSDPDPSIITRSYLISEVGEYLIAPVLQYEYNSWIQYSGDGEGSYYSDYSDQSFREIIHLRIGQYCPADSTYTVFNSTIVLPFIAPSNASAEVTGEGNEDSVVLVLQEYGFCFSLRDFYYYNFYDLTSPNETSNTLELYQDFQLTDSPDVIIIGECQFEGSVDGDIRYFCGNFDQTLTSPVYIGRLNISHYSLATDVVFDGFEVKVTPSSTVYPEFLLPYGPEYGDEEIPPGINQCGDEIVFSTNIPSGESIQRSMFVGSNGVISFGACASSISPANFPVTSFDIPVLAAFWTLHDHRELGEVFYRYVEDGPELWNVTNIVRSKVGVSASDFVATWAVIATWVNIPPYPADRTTFFKCAQLGAGYSDACANTNSYQVIVTTDGLSSYFITQYQCEFLNWGGEIVNAAIGFSTPEYSQVHQFSGSDSVDAIGCFDLNGEAISENVLAYKISLDHFADFLQTQALLCRDFLDLDRDTFGYTTPGELYNVPCPCSLLQARLDRRFVRIADTNEVNSVACYTNIAGNPVRCCYSLQSSVIDTDLSVYTRFSPWIDILEYERYDHIRFSTACSFDDLWTFQYYSARRRNTCQGYRPPRFICIYGDPHFITLDNLEYTFNGVGEYVLVQDTFVFSTFPAPPSFTLLGRTAVFPGAPHATILTGLIFRYDGNIVVEILLNSTAPFGMQIKVQPNNVVSVVDETGSLSFMGATYITTDIYMEVEMSGDLFILLGGSVSLVVSVKNGILDYLLSLDPVYKYNTEGLMGNWNDDQKDDLKPQYEIVPLNITSSLRDIHYLFGLSWQVGPADSFFFYEGGLTTADYANASYVPLFADEVTYTDEAIALCGANNLACLFDFSQTGSSDIAGTSSVQNSEFFVMQSDLANFPPFISLPTDGTTALLLSPGVTHTFEVLVTDEEEGVTLTHSSGAVVTLGIVSDLPLTKRYSVSVLTDNADPFSLTLLARDVQGANASLQFDITVCACVNGACREGIHSVQESSLRFKLQACVCDSGWSGYLCEEDIDGCLVQSCYPGVSCTDLPPPSLSGICGDCPIGTEGDGMLCVDFNECFGEGSLVHDCTSTGQTCVNTEGSFQCECSDGYIEQSSSCVDIDECLLNPCQQVCTNSAGSYECSCSPDWSLDPLTGLCVPDNGCSLNCGTGVCIEIDLVPTCVCDENGLSFDDTSGTCVDVDECSTGLDLCEDICTNIPTSYTCSCGGGFRLKSDFLSCADINECEDIFSVPCGVNETCVNTVGSRVCLQSAASLTNPVLLMILLSALLQILLQLFAC